MALRSLWGHLRIRTIMYAKEFCRVLRYYKSACNGINLWKTICQPFWFYRRQVYEPSRDCRRPKTLRQYRYEKQTIQGRS